MLSSIRYAVALTLTCVLTLVVLAQAQAADVQLAWDAPTTNTDGSPLDDLAGYALYVWEDTSTVATILDAGSQTAYTLTGLTAGVTYTIAVAAYDVDGNESGYSNLVTVTPDLANQTPVAVDDAATTAAGTAVTIAVLANDSDPDGDTLTIAVVTPGSYGDIVYTGTTITYTPDATFSGTDLFSYSIDDGYGGTDSAVVTVKVQEATKSNKKGQKPGRCNARHRTC